MIKEKERLQKLIKENLFSNNFMWREQARENAVFEEVINSEFKKKVFWEYVFKKGLSKDDKWVVEEILSQYNIKLKGEKE